jgi:hypothetical protein
MQVKLILIGASAFAIVAASGKSAVPNLAGTYRCEPAPERCRSAQIFEVT